MEQRHRGLLRLALAALGLMGGALILCSTGKYGPGMSPDSAHYFVAAESLASGQGYQTFNRRPFSAWPPLYPTLLALPKVIGIPPEATARALNAVAFALIIYLTGLILLNHVQSIALALLGGAAVLASFALLRVSIMAWSEPVFIVLGLALILNLPRLSQLPGPKSLAAISAIAALAMLQRYIGITFALTALIAVAWTARRLPIGKRLTAIGVSSLIMFVPIAVWLLRNYLRTATLTGERVLRGAPFIENVSLATRVIINWLVPEGALPLLPSFSLFVGGSAAVLALLYLRSRRQGFEHIQVWGMAIAVGLHLAWIIGSATYSAFDALNDRLLSPILPFTIALSVIALDEGRRRASDFIQGRLGGKSELLIIAIGSAFLTSGTALMVLSGIKGQAELNIILSAALLWAGGGALLFLRRNRAWAVEAMLTTAGALWLLYPMGAAYDVVERARRNGGGGYASTRWMESDVMVWLRAHPLEGVMFSNAPDAIYVGAKGARALFPDDLLEAPAGLPVGSECGARRYLVWFYRVNRPGLPSLNTLRANLELKELASFPDGLASEIVSPVGNRPDCGEP